jgi:DNA-binding MarR family transcriptional regulator
VETQPNWLSAEELEAWRNFSLMQMQLFARVASELIATGLSYQDYAILAGLSDHQGHTARLTELAETMGWEKSRMSHQLSRMEQRGLVTKSKCPTDKRGWFVTMTSEGHQAITDAAPDHVDVVRRYFIDLLSATELRTLTTIATNVLENLKDRN